MVRSDDEGVRAALEAFLDQGESRDEIKCRYCGDSHAGNNCRVTGGHDFDATGGTVWEFSGEAVEALRAALSTPVPVIPMGTREGQPRGSASAAEGVQECFRSVALWADETFGPAAPIRRLERAGEELDEAKTATPAKLMEEIADVVICLAAAAHSAGGDLQAAIDAKMAINRARRWKVMGDGTGYHIPQDGYTEPGAGAASALPSPLPSQGKPVALKPMGYASPDDFAKPIWKNGERSIYLMGKPSEVWSWPIYRPEDVAEALATERARADSLKAELDEANARLADLAKPEEEREWLPSATIDRLQARADSAAEDERDRLYAKAARTGAADIQVFLIREGAMLPDDRAALRARTILKETPHDER